MQLVHGGDWKGYADAYGREALDFSANVSPLGLPPAVEAAAAASLVQAARYPDPLCREPRAALAQAEGVPAEHILCGSGAADLIFRLVLAVRPRRALLAEPAFAEYAAALQTVDCEIRRYFLREEIDFALTEEFLDAITPGTELVFLCQPNNPTGRLAQPELVRRIAERCAQCGALLAADECFLDFLPEREHITAKPLLAAHKNVVIFKAFTKLYGMAGLRLGYCLCANEPLLARMRAAGQPWAVSGVAQAAGVAALRQTEYAARVRELVACQRPLLEQGLRALGLRVVPGSANFLLFRAPQTLGQALRAKGIVLRSCANFEGLGPEWYRTAVRTGPENESLLRAIGEVLA